MTPRDPNRIRVELDVVLGVPGEGVESLAEVSLSHALVLGLRSMGFEVKQISGGYRQITRLEPGAPLPKRLRPELKP